MDKDLLCYNCLCFGVCFIYREFRELVDSFEKKYSVINNLDLCGGILAYYCKRYKEDEKT